MVIYIGKKLDFPPYFFLACSFQHIFPKPYLFQPPPLPHVGYICWKLCSPTTIVIFYSSIHPMLFQPSYHIRPESNHNYYEHKTNKLNSRILGSIFGKAVADLQQAPLGLKNLNNHKKTNCKTNEIKIWWLKKNQNQKYNFDFKEIWAYPNENAQPMILLNPYKANIGLNILKLFWQILHLNVIRSIVNITF